MSLQPACLRWARERAGLTEVALARKLGMKKPGKVIAWEQTGEISWSQAERLAEHTHIPFGYLFLPEPLVETLPISDFRTIKTQDIPFPKPELLDVINDALLRQDWYRDYARDAGWGELDFVDSLKPSRDKNDIIRTAEQIRSTVHWNGGLQKKTPTLDELLTWRVKAVEDARILVMRSKVVGNTQRTLSVGDFRGFALSDKYAPLIFINSGDAKAAQMFTLAHELVHLWLGLSGISNLNKTRPLGTSGEIFCNAVAGELLVPTEKLNDMWKMVDKSKLGKEIVTLTRVFRVSSLVILRRLRDIKAISEDEFQLRYKNEDDAARLRQKRSAGFGDPYRRLQTMLGTRFASALVESTLEGQTPYRQAIQLMGTKDTEIVHKLALAMGVLA
jgi:Zn-dependent peptidase ImmA (M78 family)/transcriptional regulator with XRE-family HTH domain